MRKLIKLFVLLIVLVIVGVAAAFFYIDTIAKAAVERGATYALGVQTTLKTAKVKPFAGEFVMKGLNVANPAGYQTSHFLTLSKGDVSVTLSTLTEDLVVLPHLRLDELDVNLEKKDGKSNYQVILENLKKLESGSKPAEPDSGGKRFVIKTLTITNVTAHAELLPIGGSLTRVDVPIDAIELKDVGSDNAKGVVMSELVSIIFKAVLAAAIKNGGGIIPDDILGDLSSQLAGLKDIEKLVDIKSLGTGAEDLGNKVKEGVGKTIGNLLGGDKDKK